MLVVTREISPFPLVIGPSTVGVATVDGVLDVRRARGDPAPDDRGEAETDRERDAEACRA